MVALTTHYIGRPALKHDFDRKSASGMSGNVACWRMSAVREKHPRKCGSQVYRHPPMAICGFWWLKSAFGSRHHCHDCRWQAFFFWFGIGGAPYSQWFPGTSGLRLRLLLQRLFPQCFSINRRC